MSIVKLAFATPSAWTKTVMDNFDAFLLDHAAAEKKAAGMASSMLSHYPDKTELVLAMADLAIEELTHFREVVKIIHQRELVTGKDAKDPYVLAFRESFRRGKDEYFLDRMLVGAIIEARGAERFGLIAKALEAGEMKNFYKSITRSEQRHEDLFVELAYLYFDKDVVDERLAQLIAVEGKIVEGLPLRAALH